MQLNGFKVITLDGGAASGKSSTAKAVANKLHFLYVDSGGHYRAVTHMLLEAGIKPNELEKVITYLKDAPIETSIENNFAQIKIKGKILTDKELRSDAVNGAVSHFAAIPEVRQYLFDYQREQKEIAQEKGFKGIILEGRDMGTVVFKDADFHYFLEADEETRSLRRKNQGQNDSIAKRDALDKSRKTAPLTCPEDFTKIDTSKLSLNEVVGKILKDIEK